MDTQPAFDIHDVIASVVGQVADAVSQRVGKSARRQDERARATTDAIMAFEPRDAIEAIVGSHCLMFHELIVATVHRTLCGEDWRRSVPHEAVSSPWTKPLAPTSCA